MFGRSHGNGYPPEREISQSESRETLKMLSKQVHLPFHTIVSTLPDDIVNPVLNFPGVMDLLQGKLIDDQPLRDALVHRVDNAKYPRKADG